MRQYTARMLKIMKYVESALSHYSQITLQIKPIACLHKVSAEDTSAAQPADLAVDIFQVYGDGIALGAKIVHLESVAAIECVCIAANTGEVLLLHTSPHEVSTNYSYTDHHPCILCS